MSQDWDELEALRESLREHMAEIKRLNDCLVWEQHRAEHIGTHGFGCAEWGPRHYECLLRAHKALKERTDRSADTGKTSDVSETNFGSMAQGVDSTRTGHIGDADKMVATLNKKETVEPVAYVTGYRDGWCVISPVEHVVLPTGMALYRSPFKRKPLTDAEIAIAAADIWGSMLIAPQSYRQFARAIERAHGIGGEE